MEDARGPAASRAGQRLRGADGEPERNMPCAAAAVREESTGGGGAALGAGKGRAGGRAGGRRATHLAAAVRPEPPASRTGGSAAAWGGRRGFSSGCPWPAIVLSAWWGPGKVGPWLPAGARAGRAGVDENRGERAAGEAGWPPSSMLARASMQAALTLQDQQLRAGSENVLVGVPTADVPTSAGRRQAAAGGGNHRPLHA